MQIETNIPHRLEVGNAIFFNVSWYFAGRIV